MVRADGWGVWGCTRNERRPIVPTEKRLSYHRALVLLRRAGRDACIARATSNTISGFLTGAIATPFRLIRRKERPETGWDLAATFPIYLLTVCLLSLPLVILDWPPGPGRVATS